MESFPADIWEAAKTAGPFGTMLGLMLWWLERNDRLRLQRERDALLERVLSTANNLTDMVKEAIRLVRGSGA